MSFASEPGRDDNGLPPVNIEIPDDARELARDVLAYHREQRANEVLRKLLERAVGSARELEKWLLDRSELSAACAEARADLYISMSCDTDNAEAQAAYGRYIEEVAPRLTPLFFELDKRLAELSAAYPLPEERYGVLLRGPFQGARR